jgi:hypothetical protein
MMRNPPAPTEPIASTIIGQVITGGDSCGWKAGAWPACAVSSAPAAASASQRRLPHQVMNIIRVM